MPPDTQIKVWPNKTENLEFENDEQVIETSFELIIADFCF